MSVVSTNNVNIVEIEYRDPSNRRESLLLDSMVEVTLPEKNSFLKVKETLTRIGIANNKTKQLYQSCHILHKKNKFYIVHFKEMFLLDGKSSSISEEDIERRNAIANLLEDWGLVTIVDKNKTEETSGLNRIKVLAFKEKDNWELVPKYTIGKKSRQNANSKEY